MVKKQSQLACVTASTVATHISCHAIMGMRTLPRTSSHQTACLVLLQPGTYNFLSTSRHPSLTDLGMGVSSTTVNVVGAPGTLRDHLLSHRLYLLLCRQQRDSGTETESMSMFNDECSVSWIRPYPRTGILLALSFIHHKTCCTKHVETEAQLLADSVMADVTFGGK